MAKFKRNKIYYFRYDARWKERLPAWDKQPLMFPLNPGTTHTLGINIHWIPQKYRRRFVEWMIDKSIHLKNNKAFSRLVYNTVKNTAVLRIAMPGIRMYINHRATQLVEIPRKEVQDFFLPRKVAPGFFKKHRAKKVYKR